MTNNEKRSVHCKWRSARGLWLPLLMIAMQASMWLWSLYIAKNSIIFNSIFAIFVLLTITGYCRLIITKGEKGAQMTGFFAMLGYFMMIISTILKTKDVFFAVEFGILLFIVGIILAIKLKYIQHKLCAKNITSNI